MICKYIYINKKTGEKILTNERKDNNDLELVREIKNGLDFKNLLQKNVC